MRGSCRDVFLGGGKAGSCVSAPAPLAWPPAGCAGPGRVVAGRG